MLLAALGLAVWWVGGPDRRAALEAWLAPDPLPRLPRPAPGTPFTHELVGEPRPNYGAAAPNADDLAFTPLIERAGLTPDPALGHTARELARFYATHGRLAPGEALAFLLDAAGAPYWGVRQAVVVTAGEDEGPLFEALVGQADRRGGWHAGVGEAVIDGRPPRVVRAALLARPAMRLEPVERSAAEGDRVRIAASLAAGHHHPTAIAARPNGELVDLPVHEDGARFSTAFVATPGTWQVELLADGPAGPTPLAQLTFHVDEPLPDIYDGVWPTEDTPPDPAGRLADLLAADREAAGRAPLARDPALDAIAAAHSAEMRALDYVGHVSPNTGQVGDRLRSAGYRAGVSGENVALNRSLQDAQAGLMRSLGHRRNILSDDFSHVGFGAVRGDAGWYVTQVFARRAPALETEDAIVDALEALQTRIAEARRRRGVPVLKVDPRLDEAAMEEARRANASPRGAVDAAHARGINGVLSGWTAALLDPRQLELPEALLGEGLRRLGLGLHRDPTRALPDVRVVILATD